MSDSIQKYNDPSNGLSKFEYVPPFTSPREENNGLDPRKIISLLMRYKWLILFFLLVGGTGAWFYADTLQPVYESRGLLLISSNGDVRNDELSQIISQATGYGTSSTLENELQVLQSRTFAEKVARDLMEVSSEKQGVLPILWITDEDGEQIRAGEAVIATRIQKNISFFLPEEKSDIVEITFSSTSPEEAAKVVNIAMEIYVENSTRQNREAASSTAEFLKKEMAEVKSKLDESERKLRNYMDATGIVQVNEQTNGMVQQQTDVELELQRARLDLETIQETIGNYEKQLDRVKPGLTEQLTEAIGPKIRAAQEDLASYERERTLIISKNPGVLDRNPLPARLQYLDKQIVRLKEQIQTLSEQLFTEDEEYLGMDTEDRAQMVSNLQARLVELRIEENQLKSQIDALEEYRSEMNIDINKLPEGIVELAKLQRDVRINEELYMNISRQYADMSVWKQSQFGFGRIVDPGQTPLIPVSPNKKILLLLGVMIGGLVSAGFIFVREFRDNSVNDVSELKSMYLPPVMVVPTFEKIPRRKRKTFKVGQGKIPAELVLMQDKSSIASEAIRRLKNNIIYQYGDMPPKTIAITSPEKGDGKSTIVSNLGIALAEEGYKTLLIGADFRRPKLGNYFGLTIKKGLADYLDGKLSFGELIRDTDQENLHLIGAGENAQNPEVLANSLLFRQLIKKMEESYDVIIIDTPPFGIISDSTAILKNAEATIVVAKYRKTNKGMLLHMLEELNHLQAKLMSIVLNDFDHTKESGSYYGSGYYQSLYTNYETYVK